jgi:hypothetical protein
MIAGRGPSVNSYLRSNLFECKRVAFEREKGRARTNPHSSKKKTS